MHKLERALERAREDRSRALDGAAARSAPELGATLGSAPAGRSRIVDLDRGLLAAHRIVARNEGDPTADLFRILRTKIVQSLEARHFRSVGITSANYGDGKTTVAGNLALSMALGVRQTVCLVDLDLRRPSLHRCLGIETELGLTDHLLQDTPLADCLIRPNLDRMVVLPSVRALPGSSEILGGPKMAALARELRTRYDDRIVIYDLPPVLPQDDVIGFLPNLEAVLVVVRAGVTSADELQRCLHALGDVPILGTILNGAAAFGASPQRSIIP